MAITIDINKYMNNHTKLPFKSKYTTFKWNIGNKIYEINNKLYNDSAKEALSIAREQGQKYIELLS